VCLFKSSRPALHPVMSEGMSPYEIYYVLATDEEIQRLNELSAAIAGFAALPNNSSPPLGHLRAIARSGIFDVLAPGPPQGFRGPPWRLSASTKAQMRTFPDIDGVWRQTRGASVGSRVAGPCARDLAQWPVSGLWVIGLFVGIDLIFYGCAWIALALSLRTM
jgi:hypothetical protein